MIATIFGSLFFMFLMEEYPKYYNHDSAIVIAAGPMSRCSTIRWRICLAYLINAKIVHPVASVQSPVSKFFGGIGLGVLALSVRTV
jgi:hypothetical protein